MKRFRSLFLQDLTLAYRSGHVLITGLLLAMMLGLILFLPKELEVHNEAILDATEEGRLAAYLRERGAGSDVVFTDETAFQQVLERQPNKVGVVYTGGIEQPSFEIITSSAVAEENINLLMASLDRAVLDLRAESGETLPVSFLRTPAPPPPFNLQVVPVALVFEVVLLGFLIVAVMMFQEKQEATLLAYRVTPSGALNYVTSKNSLFIALSLAYALPLLLVGFGLSANYALLIVLLVLSSSLMTMLSIAIAVFFRNLSEWFFVGVAVLVVNSLPMISYGLPAFAPAWLTWIPSYPAVFAVRNVLFGAAGPGDVAGTVLYLGVLNLFAFAAAYAAVRNKLLKEGR